MKKLFALCLFVFILAFTAVCFAEKTYTNNSMTLTVPDEYADLVLVETPENDEHGMLFTVTEIESLEEAKKQEIPWNGAGWLFSIARISEEEMHKLRCEDIPGYILFAKDINNNYYVYYHPTDVRIVRADYSDQAALEIWGKLNEWGHSVRETFITENKGLTPEKFTNTQLDVSLANMMYMDDVNYTVSTLEYGPQQPNGIKASDYITPLVQNVTYSIVRDEEAPDGEYVVLNFPDVDLRFDFFLMDGKENYIRQTWFDGKYELLYKAEFDDENIKASQVMNDFYHEIVLHNSLGYTADDMVGTWTEKIAGRGNIEIEKAAEDGKYNIHIHWSANAAQKAYWEMTAEATGKGAELRYENGKHSILTWDTDDNMTEEVVYTNGTGNFDLLSTYELIWNDETGNAADDTVFINTGK